MGLEFKVDMSELEKAFDKYPDKLAKNLRLASKRSAGLVEDYARQNHRYQDRTTRLTKSIIGYSQANEVKLILGDEGSNFGTEYGKYVHSGHGSWGADKFIFRSMKKNKEKIFKNWQRAIDETNKGF